MKDLRELVQVKNETWGAIERAVQKLNREYPLRTAWADPYKPGNLVFTDGGFPFGIAGPHYVPVLVDDDGTIKEWL